MYVRVGRGVGCGCVERGGRGSGVQQVGFGWRGSREAGKQGSREAGKPIARQLCLRSARLRMGPGRGGGPRGWPKRVLRSAAARSHKLASERVGGRHPQYSVRTNHPARLRNAANPIDPDTEDCAPLSAPHQGSRSKARSQYPQRPNHAPTAPTPLCVWCTRGPGTFRLGPANRRAGGGSALLRPSGSACM